MLLASVGVYSGSMLEAYSQAKDLHRQGQLDAAWELYQQAAPLRHRDGAYWFWLAILGLEVQETALARDCLAQALRLNPPLIPLWNELGAERQPLALELIFVLPQRSALAWLDTLSSQLSDVLRADVWERLIQLGWRSAAELESLLSRSEYSSSWPEGWHLLATLQMRQGRIDAARGSWRWQRERFPDFAPAALHLGHLALQQSQLEPALNYYHDALKLQPVQPELHYHLGRISLSLLQTVEARGHFDTALKQAGQLMQPHPLWNVQREMAYAPLLPDGLSADVLLSDLLSKAQGLKQRIDLDACAPDLLRGGIEPCFDLNYLSENEASVRAAFSDIFILPEMPQWRISAGDLRMGVVVTPGHEGLFLASSQLLLTELAAAGVMIEILGLPASELALSDLTQQPGICFIALAVDVSTAVSQVQARELDLVYYWESGTDPLNYFLPLYQLGRVQFTSWGSVSSTGHARMQYFLSADALETPNSQSHYRERLKLLPVLPIHYPTALLRDNGRSRQDLNLPEGLLIGCPHNPQKHTAEFLNALKGILTELPDAHLVLLESRYPAWQQVLVQRVSQVLGKAAQRVIWQTRLDSDDFGSLLRVCDLLLDPFSFGSGKLAFDAIGRGLPLLTLPGKRLRGRITAAAYQQINYSALCADSPKDYVQKAVSLLKNPEAIQTHRQALLERRDRLIKHPDVVPAVLAALKQIAGR